MSTYRIENHPILATPSTATIPFTWQGQPMMAREGEMIASALFAHGIRTFGHHHRDGSPQGIFCANGQCAQCMVIADDKPVKACMTPVTAGMRVEALDGLPTLPEISATTTHAPPIPTIDSPVLILGGGPAGMSAAVELAQHGVRSILVDDKPHLGGKLVLQTHRFFGDSNAVYAGTRGIDIATRLENAVREHDNIEVWTNSTALAVFEDGVVGILRESANQQINELSAAAESANHESRITNHESRITNHESSNQQPTSSDQAYVLVRPKVLLVATGAREKSLAFKGNTLPGVYGAGAFQTLVNRDLVKAAERLFIVGGGNVGLIAGYHALQAGIEVVGLVEAMPECGGYKVHKDKLVRMGVPIYTRHTVVSANGAEQVESITIAEVNAKFQPIPGTEKSFACDTVLIAVGLDPVNEFYEKAKHYDIPVYAAGDADAIAEASAAMFTGKIRGREIAQFLGADVADVPPEWQRTADILKSHPGECATECVPEGENGVMPIFHCSQEIPCNPCTSVCPQHLIHIDPDDIRHVPEFLGAQLGKSCLGCEKCVTICPGLAITLVDYRQDTENPIVTLAYEFSDNHLHVGDTVTVLDTQVRAIKRNDHTVVVKVRAPKAIAKRIAGIRVQQPWVTEALAETQTRLSDDIIVCRCERVTAGEIRALIRKGYRDINEIKAVTRAGMGACGGKTCTALIHRLFRQEGIPIDDVTPNVKRPLFIEAPLDVFAGGKANHANEVGSESQVTNSEQPASSFQLPATSSQHPNSYPLSPKSYDAIIIGAGSVGVPTALALAQAGVKTLVLDSFASQGQGSNKSAIGGVRATHSDAAKIRLCLRSLEIFSTWEQKYGHNIEWTTGGYSFVAYQPEQATVLQNLIKQQQAHGLNIDWYAHDALLECVPGLNPNGLLGGTYSPGDGHCSPLLAGHAMYDAAKQAGATFHFGESVRAIHTENGRVTGVRTDQGDYHTSVVINAAGAWAADVGAMVGLAHPITSEAHEAGITEPVAHFLNPLIVDIRPAPGSKNYYFFQLHSGQVVFCITPEPPITGRDREETSDFLPLVAPRMVNLMPRLANIRVRRTWRGLYPMTPDGVPIVGWSQEVQGYMMAIGMCGQGFMLGPGLGELLARMVTRTSTETDAAILEELSPYRAFVGSEALK